MERKGLAKTKDSEVGILLTHSATRNSKVTGQIYKQLRGCRLVLGSCKKHDTNEMKKPHPPERVDERKREREELRPILYFLTV